MYKAWINCCLTQIGDERTVNDLAEDLKDGFVLCQLIKSTTGHDITQYQQVNAKVHYYTHTDNFIELIKFYFTWHFVHFLIWEVWENEKCSVNMS